jgi:predicted DNA-binding transcriptional regulator AlpA
MANVNKVILIGNIGHSYSHYKSIIRSSSCYATDYKQPNGREHAPTLSISDDMPESGGGGAAAGVTDGPDVAAGDDDEGGDGDGDPDRQSRKAHTPSIPKVGAALRISSTNKRRDGAVNQMTSNPRADAQPTSATISAGALPSPQNPDIALWRLPTVLAHVPVSRSHWWAGVAEGRYPAPVKLSKRCVAWRSADIRTLIASF